MTDEPIFGLGALPDPPDARDYPVSALYLAEGLTPTPEAALPASYVVARMGPVLDQGASPQCVAFSSSAMKTWQDKRDQEQTFDFDEGLFFRQIGGTDAGAYTRDAFLRMKDYGYPPIGNAAAANVHRIAAFYSVPWNMAELKAAIYDLGPIVIATAWYRSWFRPSSAGVLPAADVSVGGHAIVAYGWDAKGLRLRNSWGADWGVSGDCWMQPYQLASLHGAYKAVDQVVHPIAYAHTIDVLARPSLNVRKSPSTAATKIASLAYGRDVATTRLEKYGGKYVANGVARTDWLEVKLSATRRGWVARGFTRLLK